MRSVWRLLALLTAAGCAFRIYAPLAGLFGGRPAGLATDVLGAVCFPLALALVAVGEVRYRSAQRETRRVARLWEGFRATSRDVVWDLAPDGTVRGVNDATVELLGAPARTFLGRSVLAILHPDDVERARGIIADCVDRAVGWQAQQVRILLPDGRTRWVESSGVPALDRHGRVVAFTASARRLDADDAHAALARLTRARVESVLRSRALHIEWQPIFALGDQACVGAEALSRFDAQPARGPQEWFADAQQVGLGVELELLAIELALASAAELPGSLYLSLNASPATVCSGTLLPVLRRWPQLLPRIVLELTEHELIDDYEQVLAPLAEMRAAGIRLAVDDAGAGFASFRHVLQLRPDIVKLDRSITHGLTHNPAQRALAAAVVMFALEVGQMTVTAEGVETPDDLSVATLLGIDCAQGFVLARPGPVTQVISLCRTPSTGRRPGVTVDLSTPTEAVRS